MPGGKELRSAPTEECMAVEGIFAAGGTPSVWERSISVDDIER